MPVKTNECLVDVTSHTHTHTLVWNVYISKVCHLAQVNRAVKGGWAGPSLYLRAYRDPFCLFGLSSLPHHPQFLSHIQWVRDRVASADHGRALELQHTIFACMIFVKPYDVVC